MGSVVIGINTYPYDAEPDHCPTCHHGIQAIQIGSNVVYKPEREGSILQLLFRCPRPRA